MSASIPSSPSSRTLADIRAAIERELQDRLRARAPSAKRLQCLECRQLNSIDARFCTQCGARFNAQVVDGTASPSGSEGAAR